MISPSKMKQETSDSQDEQEQLTEKSPQDDGIEQENDLDLNHDEEMDDGEEQDIPHVDGEEQEIPHVDGEEQEIPHADGEEQEIPHVDGEEQEIPHADGEDQEIPHVDGEEQENVLDDGEENEIAQDNEIPQDDGEENVIAQDDGEDNEIPQDDGEENVIPHDDGAENEIPQDVEFDLRCHEELDDDELDDDELDDEEPIPQHPDLLAHDQDQDELLYPEEMESLDDNQVLEEDAVPVYRLFEDEAAVISSLKLKPELIMSTEGVNSETRSIAIDSMLGSLSAQLYPRAVYLAVQIYDRYVSLTVSPEQLNHDSIASVALYIAAKFEYGITKEQRTTFAHRDANDERSILRTIDYRLHKPTTNLYVETILLEEASILKLLCSYITELSLLDLQCAKVSPSTLAVACVFLGKFILHPHTRPQVESPFPITDDLRQAVLILYDIYTYRRFPFLRSTRNKYLYTSQWECLETIPEEFFD